jgi:plasmid stabilization system protein ParE
MVFKIIWSSLALKTYMQNVEYLEKNWTAREREKFIEAVQRKLSILAFQPKIGRLTKNKFLVRQTVIHKRVILVYRFRPLKKEIELVRFFNTYQKPA